MDPDLILIFAFVIVLTVVLGASLNGVVQKILDYKREQLGFTQGGLQNTLSGDRLEMIEDRLQVLERLATDRGALLADEIEALRQPVLETTDKAQRGV